MIAVCIATYNHERFIAQAIESVLAQECEQPICLYIGDDASTDGTEAVCRAYAAKDERIAYLRREKNMGLVDNTLDLYRLILKDGCAYVAMLDGDDYWSDTRKLQSQIDYLDTHPEVGFVHTAAYDEIDGRLVDVDGPDKPVGNLRMRYNLIGAQHTNCTVLFRSQLLKEQDLDDLQQQHFPVLDYPLYGIFSQYTQFGYIHSYTAVWRRHASVSNPMKWRTYIHYKKDRIRMWKWLDAHFQNRFHYSKMDAIKWLSNAIIAFFLKK